MGFDVALARRAATATAHSSLEVQIDWIVHAELGESSDSSSNGGNGAGGRGGANGGIRTIAVAGASAGRMGSRGLGAGAPSGSSGKGKTRMGEPAANGTCSIAASRDCPITPVGAAYVPPDCSDC